MIQFWYVFMNLLSFFVRLIWKVGSPMTKIRRYDENSILIIEILGESLTILFGQFLVNNSNNNRDDFDFILLIERFFYKG